ncbi:MAG: hypothetical protein OXH68_21940 [Gammaproteobacteria bacterium]|nr:hypothetical protein [Gammaproteobacteria bacterium]
MDTFEHKPLEYLKRDVRKRVEVYLGCELEHLPPRTMDAIQREIIALRGHYRDPATGGWQYGRNRPRLVAYALAYYPYYVELVSDAIQIASKEFVVPRRWDLTPDRGHTGTARYAIVGCGAGPELYGLLRHLAGTLYSSGNRASVTPDISISLFEPERERWAAVAEAVTKPLIGRIPWIEQRREAGQIRIGWSPDPEPIPSLSLHGEYDFVLIQLVLNEVDLLWPTWLSRVMEANLAPGGTICVIDTNHAVHDQLRELGFCPAKSLSLEWSEAGPRKLDPITSSQVFRDADGLIERRGVKAMASFWENAAIRGRRRLPPRRMDSSRSEKATPSHRRRIDLFG